MAKKAGIIGKMKMTKKTMRKIQETDEIIRIMARKMVRLLQIDVVKKITMMI
jgi:hypothetical protein